MLRQSPVSIMAMRQSRWGSRGSRCCRRSLNDAVGVDVRPVVQEKFLDDVRLVTEAQNEVPVAVLRCNNCIRCQRIGLSPMEIIGFGIFSE